MKNLLFFLVLFCGAGPVFSQTPINAGLKVNGVALGATREEVIKKLGKPVSQSKRKADECVGGTEITLNYPGLKLQLWDDPENPKKFTVGFFEVTSAKWNASGSRVGDASAAVKKTFGTASSKDSDGGRSVWYYEMNEEDGPGTSNFEFRGGKVVKITTAWLMC
jgi:hypothetical protein